MATSEFEKVAIYFNALQAEHHRGVLEENGIRAYVEGAEVNTTLSYVGSALGGVKLFVASGDVDQAREVLDNLKSSSDESAEAWFCGDCEEIIEAGFDICWSCGEPRSAVEGTRPEPLVSANETVETTEEVNYADDETPTARAGDSSNPYRPTTNMQRAPEEPSPIPADVEVEEILVRAWRASVIGILILPFVLHVYSMYLLIRAARLSTDFSARENRLFYQAFFLNIVVTVGWGLFLRMVSA